jgi:hypothetical protein
MVCFTCAEFSFIGFSFVEVPATTGLDWLSPVAVILQVLDSRTDPVWKCSAGAADFRTLRARAALVGQSMVW